MLKSFNVDLLWALLNHQDIPAVIEIAIREELLIRSRKQRGYTLGDDEEVAVCQSKSD
jgi:hypothetical protein